MGRVNTPRLTPEQRIELEYGLKTGLAVVLECAAMNTMNLRSKDLKELESLSENGKIPY